jgi:hypothetical protein
MEKEQPTTLIIFCSCLKFGQIDLYSFSLGNLIMFKVLDKLKLILINDETKP